MASVLCLMNLKHSALGEVKSRKLKLALKMWILTYFRLILSFSHINTELYKAADNIENDLDGQNNG